MDTAFPEEDCAKTSGVCVPGPAFLSVGEQTRCFL